MDKALIVNIERLKNDSYLDKNVSNNDIRVAVLFIQDEIIEHVTGSLLFDCIKMMIINRTIDCPANSIYKQLLDDYLFPIFVYAVQAEISIPKSFKVRNIGTIQQTGDNVQQTGLGDIKYLNSYYRNKADFYIQRAIKFLACNRDCLPELRGCSCSWCEDRPFSKLPYTSLNLKIVDVKKRI
ncbi:MAG: hypothetical protein LUH10_00520 [Tannerellaceae bacterium]|nr:hypothetical protein [Tannerellaceae bacterium]